MKRKSRVLTWVGLAFCLTIMAVGCASFQTASQQAAETDHNKIIATAAWLNNPLGQSAAAIDIHAEAKQPELAYRRTTVTTPSVDSQASPPAKTSPSEMPKDLKSAKLRWVPPSQPYTPPKQPAPPQVVVDEEGYYPSTTPLASAGGTGAGFLQTWGNALLGNAPMALGVWGAAKVLRPAQTNVSTTQTGGGASQTQGQVSKNANLNANKNINPTRVDVDTSAVSGSFSAADASAISGKGH